jgi:nitroreductase
MELSRRKFIKSSFAVGALAMGFTPFLSACGRGVRRGDIKPVGRLPEAIPDLDDQSAGILHYASLAPSGHNAQPWYVKVVNRGEWIIGADPERRLPTVDPNNREVMLSIGAFAENLSIAAAVQGYKAEMEVIASSTFDEDIIRISMIKAKPIDYSLQRLTTRRTVKHGYRSNEIRSDDVRALSKPLEGRLVYFPRGSDHAKCIEKCTIENFRRQTYRDDAQRELASWTRFSNQEAREHRDGLTPEGMEIKGFAGWYVRNFMKKQDVLKERFKKTSVDLITKLAGQGAGWFIIASEGGGVSDLIETGRRFERMVLMAREHKIGVHPMTQCLEEKTGQNEIALNHPPNVIPQFVLRVGYLDSYPDPVTLRRPVSLFLRTG